MKRGFFTAIKIAVLSLGLVMCATTDVNKTETGAFEGYESWTKVNTETITGDTTSALGSAHEGTMGFREVFVNTAGETVALGKASYPFPEGSILVKEAYKNSGGNKGALSNLTIMVKREAGYDPDNGDWEYLMTNAAKSIQRQGPLDMCIGCHSAASSTDFVFTKR